MGADLINAKELYEKISSVETRLRVSGVLKPSGATVSLITTEIELNDSSWTLLQGGGFNTRNTLNVENKLRGVDTNSPILIRGDLTAGTTDAGTTVLEGDNKVYQVQQVPIYGKTLEGTFKITIEELS